MVQSLHCLSEVLHSLLAAAQLSLHIRQGGMITLLGIIRLAETIISTGVVQSVQHGCMGILHSHQNQLCWQIDVLTSRSLCSAAMLLSSSSTSCLTGPSGRRARVPCSCLLMHAVKGRRLMALRALACFISCATCDSPIDCLP